MLPPSVLWPKLHHVLQTLIILIVAYAMGQAYRDAKEAGCFAAGKAPARHFTTGCSQGLTQD